MPMIFLHFLSCHFNDPSRGWPALRLAPISPCLLPVVAFSNFMHTHTFVTNSHTYIAISFLAFIWNPIGWWPSMHFVSRLSHKNKNISICSKDRKEQNTPAFNQSHQLSWEFICTYIWPHLVQKLECMLYTVFFMASGWKKMKPLQICLERAFFLMASRVWLRKMLFYSFYFQHCPLPLPATPNNTFPLLLFGSSQSLEI